MTRKTGPKPLIDETRFRPRSIREAEQLYRRLVDVDVPQAQAANVVMWLVTLPERRSDDPRGNSVRRNYRRALSRLGEPPWDPTQPPVEMGLVSSESKGAYLTWAELIRVLSAAKQASAAA